MYMIVKSYDGIILLDLDIDEEQKNNLEKGIDNFLQSFKMDRKFKKKQKYTKYLELLTDDEELLQSYLNSIIVNIQLKQKNEIEISRTIKEKIEYDYDYLINKIIKREVNKL